MTIPKSIKVGWQKFFIKFVEECKYANSETGDVHLAEKIIEIRNDLPKDYQQKVFIHELIHILFAHAGIEETHDGQIESLTHRVMDLLKDNPKLFKEGK